MMSYILPILLRLQLRLEEAKKEAEEGAEMLPEKAFDWYKKLADKGNPYGELALAKCYENGYGIRKNRKSSIEHYKTSKYKIYAFRERVLFYENSKRQEQMEKVLSKIDYTPEPFEKGEIKNFKMYKNLAEAGDSEAQCSLGYCYALGLGTKANSAKAFYWRKESAKRGNADALFDMACYYLKGNFVEKDINKALYLLHKSAIKGCLPAQEKLGRFYYEGKYVEKDLGKAVMWYRINAKQTFNQVENMEF